LISTITISKILCINIFAVCARQPQFTDFMINFVTNWWFNICGTHCVYGNCETFQSIQSAELGLGGSGIQPSTITTMSSIKVRLLVVKFYNVNVVGTQISKIVPWPLRHNIPNLPPHVVLTLPQTHLNPHQRRHTKQIIFEILLSKYIV
jgi:hypothetical protein